MTLPEQAEAKPEATPSAPTSPEPRPSRRGGGRRRGGGSSAAEAAVPEVVPADVSAPEGNPTSLGDLAAMDASFDAAEAALASLPGESPAAEPVEVPPVISEQPRPSRRGGRRRGGPATETAAVAEQATTEDTPAAESAVPEVPADVLASLDAAWASLPGESPAAEPVEVPPVISEQPRPSRRGGRRRGGPAVEPSPTAAEPTTTEAAEPTPAEEQTTPAATSTPVPTSPVPTSDETASQSATTPSSGILDKLRSLRFNNPFARRQPPTPSVSVPEPTPTTEAAEPVPAEEQTTPAATESTIEDINERLRQRRPPSTTTEPVETSAEAETAAESEAVPAEGEETSEVGPTEAEEQSAQNRPTDGEVIGEVTPETAEQIEAMAATAVEDEASRVAGRNLTPEERRGIFAAMRDVMTHPLPYIVGGGRSIVGYLAAMPGAMVSSYKEAWKETTSSKKSAAFHIGKFVGTAAFSYGLKTGARIGISQLGAFSSFGVTVGAATAASTALSLTKEIIKQGQEAKTTRSAEWAAARAEHRSFIVASWHYADKKRIGGAALRGFGTGLIGSTIGFELADHQVFQSVGHFISEKVGGGTQINVPERDDWRLAHKPAPTEAPQPGKEITEPSKAPHAIPEPDNTPKYTQADIDKAIAQAKTDQLAQDQANLSKVVTTDNADLQADQQRIVQLQNANRNYNYELTHQQDQTTIGKLSKQLEDADKLHQADQQQIDKLREQLTNARKAATAPTAAAPTLPPEAIDVAPSSQLGAGPSFNAQEFFKNSVVKIEHPGDTFFGKFHLPAGIFTTDHPHGWVNPENGVSQEDVMKDMIYKMAKHHGHDLAMVHVGQEIDVTNLGLTEDEMKLIVLAAKSKDADDYIQNIMPKLQTAIGN